MVTIFFFLLPVNKEQFKKYTHIVISSTVFGVGVESVERLLNRAPTPTVSLEGRYQSHVHVIDSSTPASTPSDVLLYRRKVLR